MDKIGGLMNKLGGSSSNNANAQQGGMDTTQQTGATGQTATGQEDYGDKGLDFIEKKTGHTMSREQNEKITDGARGLYEKYTGKTVNPKYSN